MMKIRKANDRGRADMGWLHSRFTFSFAGYYDPRHMGFRSLRVINDDVFDAGGGFPTHPHADMEIITIVLEGALRHGDSLGHDEPLRPDEVQRMSAGTGIRHSEFNGSDSEPVHLLQIWIEPEKAGVKPAYGQKTFPAADRVGRLQRVAGRDNVEADGALHINQDADVYRLTTTPGGTVQHALGDGRGAWVHVATGEAVVNGQALSGGDAVAIEAEANVTITGGTSPAEVVLFDLA